MIYDSERPSFDDSNNVTVQRCFFAYELAREYITGKDIADVGCGNGYGSVYMCAYAKTVTGLDYSEDTINAAINEHRDKTNLGFQVCQVPPLPLPENSVDVVTAFQFIEHIKDQAGFIRDVYRVLRPGGVFLCTTPNNKMSIARNPFHVHEFTFDEMRTEAGKVFKNFELKGLNGNERVNRYYEENARWVKKIMKLDPLGLHKILPSWLLIKPYNFLTTKMRGSLKKTNDVTTQVTTADFHLQTDELDGCWDIYLIARK